MPMRLEELPLVALLLAYFTVFYACPYIYARGHSYPHGHVSFLALALETAAVMWVARRAVRDHAERTKSARVDATNEADSDDEHPAAKREEEEAVAASKRIVEKARVQFLAENNGSVPPASPELQRLATQALADFETNRRDDVMLTCENKPWVLRYEDKKRELRIYSAENPGRTTRWRVDAVLTGKLEPAYEALFTTKERGTWDTLVKSIEIIKVMDCDQKVGDGMAVTNVATNAVMGGLVSTRDMLDVAVQRTLPKGGILVANASIPPELPEFQLQAPRAGSIRAWTWMGSGCSLIPIPGRRDKLAYTLVSTIDLRGALAPWIVETALTTNLSQGTKQMQDYLVRKLAASGA